MAGNEARNGLGMRLVEINDIHHATAQPRSYLNSHSNIASSNSQNATHKPLMSLYGRIGQC